MSRIPLLANQFYHIYNRGVNGCNIFHEERNYRYFLQLYVRDIVPILDTYAYCLLGNHYHLLVKIRPESEWREFKPSKQFATFLGSYTKAFNKAYQRTGPLFERPFKRKQVHDLAYFQRLVIYIQQNPQKHGIVDDFREWPFSSYTALVTEKMTHLQRDKVRNWFGGTQELIESHRALSNDVPLRNVVAIMSDDYWD